MTFLQMSKKEIDRYGIISRLLQKEINGTDAAKILKLSVRQVKRLKVRVKDNGAAGLIHANRGKPSNRKMPEKERSTIVKLLRKFYADFKPAFAAEKLREDHSIVHDPKTIRQIMTKEGLWHPKQKRRQKQQHRQWRERKDHYGEMEQFDGSYHDWFEGRAPECCLLASIDDATGTVTYAQFAQDEGVIPVFAFWKEYLTIHGKPRTIYLDKFSTYQMNHEAARENHDMLTQFQRAMRQLTIEPISANSPQAKGRVERLFHTLQDRLSKELRLAGISDIPSANKFLIEVFLPRFNNRFAVPAKSKVNLHRKPSAQEQKELPSILSRHTGRTIQNDFTFSFKNQWYQLTEQQPATVCKKDRVVVEEHTNGEIKIQLRGKYLNYQVLPERPKRPAIKSWVLPTAKTEKPKSTKPQWKPSRDHPWRGRQFVFNGSVSSISSFLKKQKRTL
jgi:transposase